MKAVDKKIVQRIEQIAEELPEERRRELLGLISGWHKDARQGKREQYTELVKFSSEHGVHYGHVRDINVGGCFIKCSGVFQPGERVQFALTFISSPNPVKLTGTVVRQTARGIGIRFDEGGLSRVRQMEMIIAKHAQIAGREKS